MRRTLPLLAALVALAGCLGAERTFPDESVGTTALRVNAYTDVRSAAPHRALVELSGAGADGAARAFKGDIELTIELQEGGKDGPATYRAVKTYRLSLTPADFAGESAVPYYTHVVPAGDLPQEGTYRAAARATIAGQELTASALFAYVRQGVPAA